MPEEKAGNVGGKVFDFGSYRLGVHTRGMSFLGYFLVDLALL